MRPDGPILRRTRTALDLPREGTKGLGCATSRLLCDAPQTIGVNIQVGQGPLEAQLTNWRRTRGDSRMYSIDVSAPGQQG